MNRPLPPADRNIKKMKYLLLILVLLGAMVRGAAASQCYEIDDCIAANGTSVGWNSYCGDGSCDCACYVAEYGPMTLGRDAWQSQQIVRLAESQARMIEQLNEMQAVLAQFFGAPVGSFPSPPDAPREVSGAVLETLRAVPYDMEVNTTSNL